MSVECDALRNKQTRFLEKRRELSRLQIGGWVWSRKLQIKSGSKILSCRLHGSREMHPYESVLLPTDEFVSFRDAQSSLNPGQFVDVLVGDKRSSFISVEREFGKAPQFLCVDLQAGIETRVSRVGGNKWYQHDFLASEDGDLQIGLGSTVYFANTIPLPLAVGLKLLLDARFDS